MRRSPRWARSDNAYQITLAFWSISGLRLSDWTTSYWGRLEIVPSGAELDVRFGEALSFRCSAVRVEGVSAYTTGEVWLDARPGVDATWLLEGPAPRPVDPAELGLPSELLKRLRSWAASRESTDARDEEGRRLARALFEVVGDTHRVAYRTARGSTRWG